MKKYTKLSLLVVTFFFLNGCETKIAKELKEAEKKCEESENKQSEECKNYEYLYRLVTHISSTHY